MKPLEELTLVTAIIGAACGISGTILGIINTWSQLSRNRVRLKVIPKLAYMVGGNNIIAGVRRDKIQRQLTSKGAPSRWCIEVVNLSAFAVTISDAGFGRHDATRYVLAAPETSVGKSWPTRLEPREQVTLYARVGERLNPAIVREAVAYAETDCGKVCYGTSPIFKDYIDDLSVVQNKEVK